ncbi:MAG: TldD/PmbA family protein [Actinomycetota bacterium]|nr:TldD/PmbA family protein [Actinomycetota bacterium]
MTRSGPMSDLLDTALDAATSWGASYADVRGVETNAESLGVKGPAVESLDLYDSVGFGVRVLVDGAWGYACSAELGSAEAVSIARTAVEIARASATASSHPVELVPEPVHRDSWAGPMDIDPFAVTLEAKLELLTSATAGMQVSSKIKTTRATMDLLRQKTWFVSSEGSSIDQIFVQSAAGIEAVAVYDSEVQQRSYPGSFRGHFASGGFEVITDMDLAANAERTGEEAVALLTAPPCPATVTSVVLDGHQTMLQVHESVGHPTELDRVLGMEAAFAGTSFVGVPDLGSLRYGSNVVNINSDATIPGGLGSYGYDDEGVAAQRVDLVKEGILVGFQTSRETAARIGADRSNGTMRAEGWENFPLIRMPNINLLPGEGSIDDLLADVDDGVYMATNKSWSIDDKRLNFQFGCEIAWEIKDGRLGRMLKDPRYTGITPVFWGSCDAIAGPGEWKVWGTPNCGKGQPGQTMRVGHGTSPARFRNVSTGVSS